MKFANLVSTLFGQSKNELGVHTQETRDVKPKNNEEDFSKGPPENDHELNLLKFNKGEFTVPFFMDSLDKMPTELYPEINIENFHYKGGCWAYEYDLSIQNVPSWSVFGGTLSCGNMYVPIEIFKKTLFANRDKVILHSKDMTFFVPLTAQDVEDILQNVAKKERDIRDRIDRQNDAKHQRAKEQPKLKGLYDKRCQELRKQRSREQEEDAKHKC